jgi:hypothetical protein
MMKKFWLLVRLFVSSTTVVGLVLILAGILWGAFANFGMVYASADNESNFFKAYRPAAAIDGFDLHEGSGAGESVGSGAGRGFATHNRAFENWFFIAEGNQESARIALVWSVRESLKSSGATILEDADDYNRGHRFRYTVGQSAGEVGVEPLKEEQWMKAKILPKGVSVRSKVSIREKWTKR